MGGNAVASFSLFLFLYAFTKENLYMLRDDTMKYLFFKQSDLDNNEWGDGLRIANAFVYSRGSTCQHMQNSYFN